MIEIVYQEKHDDSTEEEGYFHIPKNIRQIGDSPNNCKIYIEDYVYTHLNKIVEDSLGVGRMAILLGECQWLNGNAYYFIRSSFQIEGIEVGIQNIPLDDNAWAKIYSIVKEHFSGQEIIGWFLSIPDFEMEINNVVYNTHLEHFGKNDKVLFAMDSVEKEEQLFVYDGSQMQRQKGYYIYYEKNEPMQSYLISKKESDIEGKTEEIDDKAVQSFRKITDSKNGQNTSRNFTPLLSVAGICLAGIVLVGGALFVKNYKKMQSMEELISYLQGNVTQEASSNIDNEPKETTGGNIDGKLDENAENLDGESNSVPDGGQASGTDQQSTVNSDLNQENKQQDETELGSDTTIGKKDGESTAVAGTMGKRYMVKKGDTISGISKSFYGTIWRVADICEANNLTSEDVIYPGQIIVLPS